MTKPKNHGAIYKIFPCRVEAIKGEHPEIPNKIVSYVVIDDEPVRTSHGGIDTRPDFEGACFLASCISRNLVGEKIKRLGI